MAMEYRKARMPIQEQREMEQLQAQVQSQEALLEYAMIMADIDLPESEEEIHG